MMALTLHFPLVFGFLTVIIQYTFATNNTMPPYGLLTTLDYQNTTLPVSTIVTDTHEKDEAPGIIMIAIDVRQMAIIGGISLAVLLTVLILCCLYKRRKKRRKREDTEKGIEITIQGDAHTNVPSVEHSTQSVASTLTATGTSTGDGLSNSLITKTASSNRLASNSMDDTLNAQLSTQVLVGHRHSYMTPSEMVRMTEKRHSRNPNIRYRNGTLSISARNSTHLQPFEVYRDSEILRNSETFHSISTAPSQTAMRITTTEITLPGRDALVHSDSVTEGGLSHLETAGSDATTHGIVHKKWSLHEVEDDHPADSPLEQQEEEPFDLMTPKGTPPAPAAPHSPHSEDQRSPSNKSEITPGLPPPPASPVDPVNSE